MGNDKRKLESLTVPNLEILNNEHFEEIEIDGIECYTKT
jgi:hypothetical protein